MEETCEPGRKVKFLLDECLSHVFVQRLAVRGYPDAVHPIHLGLRSVDDHVILRRALAQDRIVVTANADDFRPLIAHEAIHPGLIALPNVEREHSWRLLESALVFIELQLNPLDYMINRLIEVSSTGEILACELPPLDQI